MFSYHAIVINFIGVFFAIFSCFINIFNLKKLEKKKEDMVLFYFRFILDAFFGATILFFFAITISSNFSGEKIFNSIIFLSGFFSSLVGRARVAVTLMISVERVMAVFTPVFYRHYRPLISNSAILSLIIGYGLFDYLIMYFFCDFEFVIPTSCVTLTCSMNLCSSQYWATSKSVIIWLTFFFAIILSMKLLWKVIKEKNKDLNKANRLALIDTAIIFLFDILSNIVIHYVSREDVFNLQNGGPILAVLRQLGCVVDALLVFRTITRKVKVVNAAKTSKNNMIVGHEKGHNKQPTS
ncbi:Serpentine Receptor, class BC (Class B-like) [Caenorhabditis elegans]|uniref:Serpentine Receptor, class BC (Class B-like) n=1 Tax=Caenorhabditis elegans TaxID=6239 RepID=O44697_CAEEL|nr:Serpentine Receptor, class BC (Class B-like) [Caenorhabditis elegans]CCD67417.1 Serpentine Receptor, class BC (Class B-like) [Caenorhabditis elegans]|eukprot:NP_503585.3 Serpentine Receptor, class BC (class B-like) [Caenorhabditis elegans]